MSASATLIVEYGEVRMNRLTLKNITKSYGDVIAVKDFHLDITEKRFVVLAGPSGCGKTTLLRLIAGFLTPDRGDIYINGELMNQKAPAQRNISMVFQEAALFPHMSVYENIAFGLAYGGMDETSVQAAVMQISEMLDIQDLLKRKAATLSGGQKQRCAIARALVRKPSLFLMDEPLSSLDAGLRTQLRMELAQLYQKNDATFLYVTHDQMEAMTLADLLIVMKDGCIQQMGEPMELYQNPCNLFTASFLGVYGINQFAAQLEKGMLHIQGMHIAWTHKSQTCPVIVAVRCEHLIEVKDHGIHGTIMLVERSAEQVYYHIRYADGVVVMKGNPHNLHRRMEEIQFWFLWDQILVFDTEQQKRIYVDNHNI